jgi:dolichol-phosphate mannosyltransferase
MGSHVPLYSVLLPVYNEQDNVEPLLGELRAALGGLAGGYEVIAVDDCSRDRSLDVLRQLRSTRPELRVVCHRANCGQSAAFATGLAHARGSVVITLDADRQNDPADLPRMIAALEGGVAGVFGVRRRREDSRVRRWTSRFANAYRDWLTGVPVRDAGCFLRVMRREALREVPVFNGLHRFLATILRYQGYRIVELEVNHRPRVAGKSNYGIGNRLWRGIRDCFAMRWYRARVIAAERWLPEEPRGG